MTTAKERIKQLIKDRFYDKPEALLRFAELHTKICRTDVTFPGPFKDA